MGLSGSPGFTEAGLAGHPPPQPPFFPLTFRERSSSTAWAPPQRILPGHTGDAGPGASRVSSAGLRRGDSWGRLSGARRSSVGSEQCGPCEVPGKEARRGMGGRGRVSCGTILGKRVDLSEPQVRILRAPRVPACLLAFWKATWTLGGGSWARDPQVGEVPCHGCSLPGS